MDETPGAGGEEVEEPSAHVPPGTIDPPIPPTMPASFQSVPPTAPMAPTGEPTAQQPVPGPGAFETSPGQGGGGSLPPTPAAAAGPWQPGWGDTSPSWASPRSETPAGRRSVARGAAGGIAAALLILAGIGIGHGFWSQGSSPRLSSSPTGASPRGLAPSSGGLGSGGTATGAPSDISSIASKVDPGLVDINTTLSYQGAQAEGTGMVLTSSGEVLTNNHVIQGATSISVTDLGNGQTYGATVVGYDVTQDLAVLQLHGASGLSTVSTGDSSKLSIGQSVVGIGNAGGTGGTPSAVGGTITALNQSITAADRGSGTSQQLAGLIETNADIQPGDSGGPIVTDSGHVVGVITAGLTGYEAQASGAAGYAIPINSAIAIARQIEAGRSSATVHVGPTPFLGVEVAPPNGQGGLGGGVSPGASPGNGVAVVGVVTGDPADQAGISAGDTINSVSGTTVNSSSALTAALGSFHPGDKVQISWTDQSGQSHTASVQLASGPPA